MNGYIGFYKGKKYETYADTTYEAQQIIAREQNIKKAWQITIMLAEKNGEQVVHTPMF